MPCSCTALPLRFTLALHCCIPAVHPLPTHTGLIPSRVVTHTPDALHCCITPHSPSHVQVIKLISRVIADFANGEISQASSLFDTEVTLEQYLDKSFYKTASLVAASCRSSAVFSQMDEEHKDAMYAYGKHLGLAFQVSCWAAGACFALQQQSGYATRALWKAL